MPDVNLGLISVNESQTVHLDIKANGTAGYNTTCAKGGAKGMVVQMTIPQPPPGGLGGVGIGFDCMQTGDQVLDLFAAGGPRDPCDADELVCADPKTLPFGCGYEVPNLSAGVYNVIVEGFAPGSEGTMDLTLSVVDDRQLEICNNGIDDDGDGKIDCADRKCATSQFCTKAQCRPDQTIDPVPLTGADTVVQVKTQGNGIHGTVPCATAAGGQTGAVLFRLTAKADLTVQFEQFGNHAIALYTDDGATLPCDSGTLLACQAAIGKNASGTATFSGVPAGEYYLLIAGDQPDTASATFSGSVDLDFTGMPSP